MHRYLICLSISFFGLLNTASAQKLEIDSHYVSVDSVPVGKIKEQNTFTKSPSYLYISRPLSGVVNHQPAYSSQIINTTLGNAGLAIAPFWWETNFQKNFTYTSQQPFAAYMYALHDADYYKVTSPYTHFEYVIGSKREQQVSIQHFQTIAQKASIGIESKAVSSLGTYTHNATRNQAVRLWGHWYGNKKQQAIFNIVVNDINVQENGGLTKAGESYFLQNNIPSSTGGVAPTNRQILPTNLLQATTKRFYNGALFRYQYALANNFHIWAKYSHQLQRYTYIDNAYSSNSATNYYPIVYRQQKNIDRTLLQQTNYETGIHYDNSADSLPYILNITAGVKWQQNRLRTKDTFRITNIDSPLYNDIKFLYHTNSNQYLYATASFYNKKVLQVDAEIYTCLAGYNAGDRSVSASLVYPISTTTTLQLAAKNYTQKSDYLYDTALTNTAIWNNEWEKTTTNHLQASLKYNKGEFQIGYYGIKNYIYLDTTIAPSQIPSLSLFQAQINYLFSWKKWHLHTIIRIQKPSNAIISGVANGMAHASLYRSFKAFKKRTPVEYGIDAFYFSKSNLNNYTSNVGMFYNSSVKRGNALWLDVWVSMKVKRFKAFLKVENASSGLLGFNYLAAPGYPMRDRMFKIGFHWTFFD